MKRTDREFYAGWSKLAREAGATEDEIRITVDEWIREARCIAAGRCPKCLAPVCADADPRQVGMSNVPGIWLRYWCSRDEAPGKRRDADACGFRIDVKVPG
jgi:hypothetical protein